MDDDLELRYSAALDMLPPLTRAAFLLAARDRLTYAEIAWRCGIDAAEVQLRVADGLGGISWAARRPRRARHASARRALAVARRLGQIPPAPPPLAARPQSRAAQAELAPQDPWHRRFLRKTKSLTR